MVQMYLIFFAGYVFDVNYDLKFKPSFMLKSAANVNPSLDLSANFCIKKI
jgi:hypothetical protein